MTSSPIVMTAEFRLEVVIESTPHPDRFLKTDARSKSNLRAAAS